MLGEHNIDTEIDCEDNVCADPVQTFRPDKFIIHPQYNNPTFKHDIALIKLDRPAEITGTQSFFVSRNGIQKYRFQIYIH